MIRYLIKGINRLTENLNKANQRMGAHVMNLMSEESEKAIICLNAYLDNKFVTDFDKYQELTRPQICSRVTKYILSGSHLDWNVTDDVRHSIEQDALDAIDGNYLLQELAVQTQKVMYQLATAKSQSFDLRNKVLIKYGREFDHPPTPSNYKELVARCCKTYKYEKK